MPGLLAVGLTPITNHQSRFPGSRLLSLKSWWRLSRPVCFVPPGIDALDRAGIAWRLAFTSPSLAGLWAATGAGLGVTLRTTVGLPNTLAVLKPGASGLPTLPKVSLTLCKTKADSAVIRLFEILRETIAEQVTGRARLPRDPML